MRSIVEFGYAKINLYLDIVNKRHDGYHNILSIMQSVSLCDKIEISRCDDEKIKFICQGGTLDLNNENNLAYRAAEVFFNNYPNASTGVSIHLIKNIPVSAGMAGGSTDAAAVLRGMNRIFDHPFTKAELCDMGAMLGADVPFCVAGGAQITEGIGDKLRPTNGLPKCFLVVACGSVGTSTPSAYKSLDNKFNDFDNYNSGVGFEGLIKSLSEQDISTASKYKFNIFESINQENDSVLKIKKILEKNGSEFFMMSGSGPSVYGVFSNLEDASRACEQIKSRAIFAAVCQPMDFCAL